MEEKKRLMSGPAFVLNEGSLSKRQASGLGGDRQRDQTTNMFFNATTASQTSQSFFLGHDSVIITLIVFLIGGASTLQ